MALKLSEKIILYLQERPEQKFTARQMATWILKNYPDECREKQKRSTAKVIPLDNHTALLQQIVAEIGSHRCGIQKREPNIKTTEGRPRKYYFTKSSDFFEIAQIENQKNPHRSNKSGYQGNEKSLYPLLSQFLSSELAIYSKRIEESRSSNTYGSGGNKWLYPDLVGVENLSRSWHSEIKQCVQQYADKLTKLWSFEVKLLVNRANIREAFFQTVSNSSWANFAYLVASEIQGDDTLKELRILSSLHGVGFIKLEAGNPAESQIIIPAKERQQLDWDTANRLTEQSKDFKETLQIIRQFYQTGDIRASFWDAKVDEF